MKYKTIGSGLGRDSRNDINKNFEDIDFDIKSVIASSENNETIVAQALLDAVYAKTTADEAKTTADTVQEQFDQIVAEAGSNNPEVVQARGTYTNLNQRLDSTAQQLADTDEEIKQTYEQNKRTGLQFNKDIKPTIVFEDDDMQPGAYNILFEDFVKGRGVPFLFAAISGRIRNNDPSSVNLHQLKEMARHPLVEISVHTETHGYLANMTIQQQYDEISKCYNFLTGNGIFPTSLTPPFGSSDENTRKVAKDFVESILISSSANGTVGALNCADGAFMNSHRVRRIDFSEPLETLKQHVDLAITHKALLIIATHTHYSRDEVESPRYNFVPSKLHALLDYIQTKDIEISSYSKAYERFKNPIEYKTDDGLLTFGVSASGQSKGFGDYLNTNIRLNASDAPTLEVFPVNNTVKTVISLSLATSLGYPNGGTLITSCGDSLAYVNQTLYGIRSNDIKYRAWNDLGKKWTDWESIVPSTGGASGGIYTYNAIVHPASEAPTIEKYPVKSVVKCVVATSQIASLGYPIAGTLVTSNGDALAYLNQTLYGIRKNEIKYRAWNDATSSWTNWIDLIPSGASTPTETAKTAVNDIIFGVSTTYEIPSGASRTFSLNIPGAVSGDIVMLSANADSALSTGVIYSTGKVDNNYIDFHVTNNSTSMYSLSGKKWSYALIKR